MKWTRNPGILLLALLVTADLAPAQFRRRGFGGRGRAGQWSRSTTRTGPRGKQVNVDSSGSRGNGQFSKNKTVTGPNGKSATVDTTGTYGNGQFSKDKTITGPNGRTATVDTTGTRQRPGQQGQDHHRTQR